MIRGGPGPEGLSGNGEKKNQQRCFEGVWVVCDVVVFMVIATTLNGIKNRGMQNKKKSAAVFAL